MPTIRDVAKLTGLSVGTVSNVLNNVPTVSEKNREKVYAAIAQLGYRKNQAASQLLSTRLPITEIALNAGFENMSYFIRQFRRCKGCTPSAYRNTEDPKSLPIPF